ncbi:Protein serine/threonine phosphatase PrpC, regulation of stationary phase [hydrothermal vent metagenome]|uniref:Protein serine/threonine phosphatase PrpC, regulation of stationary phase n=1 Tax=hydrothermal vent metagenome TaxID=652676 RepID=A0A3B0ZUD7_9ZZZZ
MTTTDITMRRAIKWNSAAQTNTGCVREVNEDAIFLKPEIGVWAVADGMGGYEAGDIASNMIVELLDDIEDKVSLSDIVDNMEDKFIEANTNILEYADVMRDKQMMGSTVVGLIIRGRVGVCLWVGDSRLYRYRNGELQQLSQDHSQVQELIQQGFLSEEDAVNHPEANVITRAIGAGDDVYVDINVFSTQIGDTFLLCSDGLHNSVSTAEIINCLNDTDINESVSNMLKKALENKAADNVSMIIARGEVDKVSNNKTVLTQ